MRVKKYKRLLAAVLAVCMMLSLSCPAYAAGGQSSFINWLSGGRNRGGSSGSNRSNEKMTLVEDETTVEDDTELRASTYELTSKSSASGSTTLKYFPVTMYDYDTATINNATHQVEVDNGLGNTWNGIYFSNGSPAAESYTSSSSIEEGTYIIQNARAAANKANSYLQGGNSGIVGASKDNATQWTLSIDSNGTYTLQSNGSYLTIGDGTGKTKVQTNKSTVEIIAYSGSTYANSFQIKSGSYYLNQYGGKTSTSYGGYNVNNDEGNAFYLYKVEGDSQTKVTGSTTTSTLSYAAWNWWNKDTNNNDNGQYTYSGLVNSTLDANKNISFTKPDGGIFNSDSTVKKIYTNVEMPFVYKNGTYTFDASQNGVYFYENSSQGSTAAQSNGRLYFNAGNPQSNGGSYGDGSSTVWMPFNSTQSINGESNCNYHFGMAATIPFTMTANGKMNPNDDNSEDITFSFSGDDDVWVFIDGQLVLDIGGIHNRLDATINFAENTWSLSKSNTVNVAVADYNGAAISGKIFNDSKSTGTLNQTRETFAATDSHELTIFYLERGAGSSNCKIQFNLPMKDTVSVTKRATQSISSDGTVSPLTAAEQEVVDNIDFGFTLTKNGTPVANTNYNLINANGQVISTPSTDANGHFTLRNGQRARFVGEIVTDGAEYQVVEDAVEAKGFKLPTYTYSGTSAGGFTVSSKSYSTGSDIPSTTENLTSAAVTAKGSDEAEDSLNFVCENYFDANLPNPSSRPVDDQIVIDYGLPVVIDVLANDVYRGDRIEITDVTGAQYGTATIKNGKITYQLTKQLTGVEVLTYTAKVTGSGNSGTTTTTSSESNTAKVYIIPATSMYYEENFSDLVNFTDSWSNVGTAQTDPQEPGVVGTVGDSPYGSDAAYLNDGGDSNGSSKYVDTTSGSASFSYSFTGTGTSFFARTSGTAAYMRVVIKDEAGNTVSDTRRNNIYKSVADTEVGTLYNIPVFTYEADNYGTYTVTVTLMKANADLDRGKDFYLDGIRVINPLNSSDENASVAKAAYATDGEANMTVATLREKLLNDAAIEEEVTDEDGNTTTQLKWDGENFVIFTDTNGEIKSAEEYKSNGPKEEVYLNNGQSVTFSLKDWDANTNKIYLGVKAPLGSGSVSINGNTLNLSNAADCYYEVSNYADITADEDGVKIATFKVEATSSLVSVTNIKVTGNAEFTIVNQESITADEDSGDEEVAAVAAQSLEDTTDVSDESETTEEPAAPADTEVPTEEPGTAEEPEKTEEPDLSEDADSEAETEPEASPAEEAPAEQNSGANEEA